MQRYLKQNKTITIFILAFGFNWIWENLHSQLYSHYRGGAITPFVLAKAALFDACFITVVLLILMYITPFGKKPILVISSVLIIGVLFSILLERYALDTSRWAYTEAMPVIPLLNTGITPTIQLGLTSVFTYLAIQKEKLV